MYVINFMKKKITIKELNKLAKNSECIKDQIVYRGFVDENADPDIEYDYSADTLVKISPIGKFVGSSTDGKPTVEIVDEQSVINMAKQTEELLLDKDHASMRAPEGRNTEAYGWVSGLKAILGLGDMDGLYGRVKWTSKGIELAKDRIYRFLSPVFELDAEGRATRLVNVSLTNRPALPLPPIINSEAEDEKSISITDSKKDTDYMNKDEISALVVETVKKALEDVNKAKLSAEISKEVAEEAAKQKIIDESLQTETKEEVKNEDVPAKDEVAKEEVAKEEVPEKKEEEKEVIKAEVLNSSPVTVGTSVNDEEPWRKLHGEAFLDWYKKNGRNYR